MRVALAAVAIVLSIGAQNVPPNTPPSATAKSTGAIGKLNGQKPAGENKQYDSDKSPTSPCVQSSPCFVITKPEGKSKEEQEKADSLDFLYRSYLFATIIGVVGALIGVGVLIYQTKLMRRSADAALLNAQAVIDSERAYVLVDTGEITDDFVPDPNAVEFLDIRPVVRNYGRVPAQITRLSIRSQQVPTENDLPPDPVYQNIRDVSIVLPSDTPILPLRVMVRLADFIEIRRGTPVLYIYGFVDYLAFGKERQSRFCIMYRVPGGFDATQRGFYLAVNVPEAYTRCT